MQARWIGSIFAVSAPLIAAAYLLAGLAGCSTAAEADVLRPGDNPSPPAGPGGGDLGAGPGSGGGGGSTPGSAAGDPVELPDDLAPDTLYGVPSFTGATAGEASPADAVRIVVATGPLANAFQFMNGVGVSLPLAAHYVPGSFNVGAVGGANDAADGLWALMNPSLGFLMPPDSFIVGSARGGGLQRIDFNVTPLGGTDLYGASGALFNFGVWFEAAGRYEIGFVEYEGVSRSYYSSSSQDDYHYWSDISNSHHGVRNYIEVN